MLHLRLNGNPQGIPFVMGIYSEGRCARFFMARRKKSKRVEEYKPETLTEKKPKKVVEGIEKKRPLILFSFPDVNGVRISVKARSMEEAIKKAEEEVERIKGGEQT